MATANHLVMLPSHVLIRNRQLHAACHAAPVTTATRWQVVDLAVIAKSKVPLKSQSASAAKLWLPQRRHKALAWCSMHEIQI